MRTLVWFRGKDLRVSDHGPLSEACRAGEVIPLFVLDPFFFEPAAARELPNRMVYLLGALEALQNNLAHLGAKLHVVAGRSVEVVPTIAEALKVDRVVAQRWVEPFARARDRRVKSALGERFVLYEGETLLTPGTLRTGSGGVYSVYTPFARAAKKALSLAKPLPAPKRVRSGAWSSLVPEVSLPSPAELGIEPLARAIVAGERAARERLKRFLEVGLRDYGSERDRMDHDGTSRLSADLKFGTSSVRQVLCAVRAAAASDPSLALGAEKFENELFWREFTHHTLWDRPSLLERPFRADFEGFPWRDDGPGWEAWRSGHTGYPIVDASARQLLTEGWVHNRARMISASFLTKHLLLSYKLGESHYMRHLVDGDWAQNNSGWQWSAGCGCDAQPYFRVMNPVSQGQKFDPQGDYVRRYVPELARLDARFIHAPWEAPALELAQAGVVLGKSYPRPIVEHKFARERFLSLAKKHLAGAR